MTDNRAKEIYNKLGFMSPAIVDICDELNETTKPQREIKYHLKRLNIEAEKLLKQHFDVYNVDEKVEQPDATDLSYRNLYAITAKAYDFLLSKKPSEIVVIAELIQGMESKGLDYQKVEVGYKPILE